MPGPRVTSAHLELALPRATLEVLLLRHGLVRQVLLVTQEPEALLAMQETRADQVELVEQHLIHGQVPLEQQEPPVTPGLLVLLVRAQQPEIQVALLLLTGQDLLVLQELQATLVQLATLEPEPHLAAQVEQHRLAGPVLPERQEPQEMLVLLATQEHQGRLELLERLVEAHYSV